MDFSVAIQNAFYAQSGGVTSVINATACGVLQTARQHSDSIGTVYAGKNGIIGALQEELFDTSAETDAAIEALKYTPGGAFGSCRYKLKNPEEDDSQYRRLVEIFSAHNIGYFFYNGGGDSSDTAYKVSQISERLGYPVTCIGIPKTVDNDLPVTDNCPGFGSVAKYVAVSTREAGLDVASMAATSTKVFILEVMGRHAGWIAAAAGLAKEEPQDPPHIILFPEVEFEQTKFLESVKQAVNDFGYAVVVASEGARYPDGTFLAASAKKDAFGHAQLGGLAPMLSHMVQSELGYKVHWAVSDYLQRSARHISSQTDLEQAYAMGKAAVELALAGKNGVMPIVVRDNDEPYEWHIGDVDLAEVANQEKKVPANFITENGFEITEACRQYLMPLIQGEAYPIYKNGLPPLTRMALKLVEKKVNIPFDL